MENFYKTLFTLAHQNNFSWDVLENMIPFELDLVVAMLKEHNDKIREIENQARLARDAAAARRY